MSLPLYQNEKETRFIEVKKRIIALLCIMTLLIVGTNHVTTVTTVQAASKIKIFKKFPKIKRNRNKKKYRAADFICKYKGKKYIYCGPGEKETFFSRFPTTKSEKRDYGEKSVEKVLFKGAPVWVKGSERSQIMELGEKETYNIKVKKGVKVVAIGSCIKKGHDPDGGPYCYGNTDGPYVKILSANKNNITLKAVKKATEEWIPLQVYFTYKGHRYFYNYALTNKKCEPIGWNVLSE